MYTLAEIKQAAEERYPEIVINWAVDPKVNHSAFTELQQHTQVLEQMYIKIINGESVVIDGSSPLAYDEIEAYSEQIADSLLQSYLVIEASHRVLAVQCLVAL